MGRLLSNMWGVDEYFPPKDGMGGVLSNTWGVDAYFPPKGVMGGLLSNTWGVNEYFTPKGVVGRLLSTKGCNGWSTFHQGFDFFHCKKTEGPSGG